MAENLNPRNAQTRGLFWDRGCNCTPEVYRIKAFRAPCSLFWAIVLHTLGLQVVTTKREPIHHDPHTQEVRRFSNILMARMIAMVIIKIIMIMLDMIVINKNNISILIISIVIASPLVVRRWCEGQARRRCAAGATRAAACLVARGTCALGWPGAKYPHPNFHGIRNSGPLMAECPLQRAQPQVPCSLGEV